MRDGWKEVRLGDVCTIKHGFAFKGEFFTENHTPYTVTTPGNFSVGGGFKYGKPKYYTGSVPEEYILQPKDIIVSMTDLSKSGDTLGYSALVPNDDNIYLPNQRIGLVVDIDEMIDKEYLYWVMRDKKYQKYIVGLASGSTVKHTAPKSIAQYEFFYPPYQSQKSIAATLSCLDDKIELNNKINANLEQQAQALFKHWFVDFEFPNEDGLPYKSSGREMVESELGLIPISWQVLPIEAISEKIAMGPFGSNIKVETFVDFGIPIISGNHLRGFYLDDVGYNYITLEHAEKLKNSLVYPGDIVFTHAGNIGQVALIPESSSYETYIISQRQFYLRCNQKKALPEYINYYFHSREGQGKLLANTTQTGVPSIARPSSHLKSITAPIPPLQIQLRWLKIINPMITYCNQIQKENRQLSTLRDTLLPKLMSGEIEVPTT